MKSAGYTFDIASIDHTRTSDAGPGAGQSANAIGPTAATAIITWRIADR